MKMDKFNECSFNVVLKYPDFEAARNNEKRRFTIFTDASDKGLGAVLTQPNEGGFPDLFILLRVEQQKPRKIIVATILNV